MNELHENLNKFEIEGYGKKEIEKFYAEKFQSVITSNSQFVEFLVNFYDLKEKNILDYGCGNGVFPELFSKHSQKVSGCDISSNLLRFAKKNTNNSIKYFEDDFFNSKLEDNSYDFIFCRCLGPLMKIDYSKQNTVYLKKMLSALRDDGVAYFILMGDLSGIPGDRFTGFQNQNLKTIYNFYKMPGFVSMINVLGYQAVVIAKSESTAKKYHEKMLHSVNEKMKNLREEEGEYLKCKLWLFVNHNEDEISKKSFEHVDKYLKKYLYPSLQSGICKISPSINSDMIAYRDALYFVSGNHDTYFEKFYLEDLHRIIKLRTILRTLKRKFYNKRFS